MVVMVTERRLAYVQALTITAGEAMDIFAGIDRSLLIGQSTLNDELSKQEIYDILVQSVGGNPEYLLPSSLYRKIEKEFPTPQDT
jgi:hypothetical protein